ncbi:MAG: hypothetical protein AAF982_03140, partial [Pseudomonadota bacterium]
MDFPSVDAGETPESDDRAPARPGCRGQRYGTTGARRVNCPTRRGVFAAAGAEAMGLADLSSSRRALVSASNRL